MVIQQFVLDRWNSLIKIRLQNKDLNISILFRTVISIWIAGGNSANITGLGDSRINSSIGSQWKADSRVGKLDAYVDKLAAGLSAEERKTYPPTNPPKTKMEPEINIRPQTTMKYYE